MNGVRPFLFFFIFFSQGIAYTLSYGAGPAHQNCKTMDGCQLVGQRGPSDIATYGRMDGRDGRTGWTAGWIDGKQATAQARYGMSWLLQVVWALSALVLRGRQ